jgi:hypothetical protein
MSVIVFCCCLKHRINSKIVVLFPFSFSIGKQPLFALAKKPSDSRRKKETHYSIFNRSLKGHGSPRQHQNNNGDAFLSSFFSREDGDEGEAARSRKEKLKENKKTEKILCY